MALKTSEEYVERLKGMKHMPMEEKSGEMIPL